MKRTVLALSMVLLAFSAAAVVGGSEPKDGRLAITSESSSASGTSAVGPNGTAYSTFFSVVNRSSISSELGANNMTGVINSSFEGEKVSFTGIVQTPTPCYNLTHSVEKLGENRYIFTVNTERQSGACTQVIAYHKYRAEFESPNPYQLTVKHGNETVKTLTHPDYNPGNREKPGQDKKTVTGPIGTLVHFLRNLF